MYKRQEDGAVRFRAAAGDYLAEWSLGGKPYWAAFEVPTGAEPLILQLVGEDQ